MLQTLKQPLLMDLKNQKLAMSSNLKYINLTRENEKSVNMRTKKIFGQLANANGYYVKEDFQSLRMTPNDLRSEKQLTPCRMFSQSLNQTSRNENDLGIVQQKEAAEISKYKFKSHARVGLSAIRDDLETSEEGDSPLGVRVVLPTRYGSIQNSELVEPWRGNRTKNFTQRDSELPQIYK